MFHWCADETAALVGGLSSLGIAWAWLKNKLASWRRNKLQARLEYLKTFDGNACCAGNGHCMREGEADGHKQVRGSGRCEPLPDVCRRHGRP